MRYLKSVFYDEWEKPAVNPLGWRDAQIWWPVIVGSFLACLFANVWPLVFIPLALILFWPVWAFVVSYKTRKWEG